MSNIDLSNPTVLKNYLLCQMREGLGDFYYKEKVLIFKTKNGSEFIAPSEVLDNFETKQKVEESVRNYKEPVIEEAVEEKKENIMDETEIKESEPVIAEEVPKEETRVYGRGRKSYK